MKAATAFGDMLSLSVPGPDHSDFEERFILIGQAITGHLIVVVHTEENDRIYIISARLATKREWNTYEEG